MNLPLKVTQSELFEILLNVAPIRPVFICGAPGIGKTSLVEKFAEEVGMPIVSLLGSQLAPEDIIGIPQIMDGKSRFCPPQLIAQDKPYILFLDELNGCSTDVQRAFYSLILEHRVGEYTLPEGSIVIGAGNRMQDGAIVKTMSTALVNRMMYVEMKVDAREWLKWAYENHLHPWVTDYISKRPDHLFSEPPKGEEPYSTPRSWHMLSDILKEFGAGEKEIPEKMLRTLAYGCISVSHVGMFLAYVKQLGNKELLNEILKGNAKFPDKPEDRDVLYFLVQSFRAKLMTELPEKKQGISREARELAFRAIQLIKDLTLINGEMAQMAIAEDEEQRLPDWFVMDLIKALPRLALKNRNKKAV